MATKRTSARAKASEQKRILSSLVPATPGVTAPRNLPIGNQPLAILPKGNRSKSAKAPAKEQRPPRPQKCVAKDMGHHYCLAKGCPVCTDLASRG